MRILFVTNLFPPHVIGGYELGCEMHAASAQRAGHQVLVATSMSFGSLRKQSCRFDIDVRQIFEPVFDYASEDRIYQRPLSYAGQGGVNPGNCLAFQELIRSWRPDVIWVHNPLGLGPVGILETAAASGVPTVVHLMDKLDESIRSSQLGFELSGRWAAVKRRVHAIACSSGTLQANSRIGRYASAIVVPGGVEIDAIPCRQAGGVAGLPPAGPVRMVSFGQLKSHKGVQHVVSALGVLRRQMKLDVELHLIGNCAVDFDRVLSCIAASAGCETALHRHGYKEKHDLHALLATMHLAVLPLNKHEAFGFVAPEAALHGMCVAIGCNAGCREVFPADYPYLLSARDDPQAIAMTVHRMITNGAERRAWEASLASHIGEQCDLDRVVMPRCLSYIETIRARTTAQASDFLPAEEAMERTIATWQMNRNLSHLLGEQEAAPEDKQRRLGRRINRFLQRVVPPAIQYRLKTAATKFRRRAA